MEIEFTGPKQVKKIYIVIAILSLVILLNSVNRFFAHDEFEHIHSAWYIAQGNIPYVDFFQSHHPLLWYVLVPLLGVLGQTISTIIILRVFILFFTAGIIFLVYLIAKRAARSKEVALLSVVFLLSMVMFVEKGIEIRPDVPQVFFGLLALFFFLKSLPPGPPRGQGMKTGAKPKIISNTKQRISWGCGFSLSGFSASVSFLFLQKSIFLLAALGIIIIIKWVKKEVSLISVMLFGLCFTLPLLLFAAYLMNAGALPDYLLTNWRFHMNHVESFLPFRLLLNSFMQNPVYWVLSLWAVFIMFSRKSKNKELKMIAGLALFLFLSVFVMKHPYRQYYLLPISLFSILAGYITKFLFFKYKCSAKRKARIIIIVIFIPFIFIVSMLFHSNRSQLERAAYVLENTGESDPVYDGDIQFNLFRPDLHYFWYSIKNGGLRTYNKISDNKYGDYDIIKLILKKQPKLISGFCFNIEGSATPANIEKSGLSKMYKKTPHKNLYIKK